MQELYGGRWRCMPSWGAEMRLGLRYCEIAATTKEEAALLWMSGGGAVERTRVLGTTAGSAAAVSPA